MSFEIVYYHERVLSEIESWPVVESWPVDVFADYARLIELLAERRSDMADVKYKPVRHDHARFLAKARQRPGFSEAYEALALEYALADQMLKARARAGLTQDAVAERMGTTRSAISRLEAAGRHAPSLATLKKYAAAVGCELQVKLVPRKSA